MFPRVGERSYEEEYQEDLVSARFDDVVQGTSPSSAGGATFDTAVDAGEEEVDGEGLTGDRGSTGD